MPANRVLPMQGYGLGADLEALLAGDFHEAAIRALYPPEEWPARRAMMFLENANRLASDRLRVLRETAYTMAEVEQGLQDLLRTYPGYADVLRRVLSDLQGG